MVLNIRKKLLKLPPGIQKLIQGVSVCAAKDDVKVYLVGGMVRDLIINRTNFDLDLVVEADAIKFARRLSDYFKVDFRKHHRFKTATVFSSPHKIDLATARREYYSYWGALPRVEKSGLEDDLERRDFSINSLALSLNEDDFGEVVDFCRGIEDLRRGYIRVMHKYSFLEDPTRILRAIRFKKRFHFKFEPKTRKYLKKACEKEALNFVNESRLRNELILILKEEDPVKYIREINKVVGLGFLGAASLEKEDFLLFNRIKRNLDWFKKHFLYKGHIDEWLIFLMGLFYRVHVNRLRFILVKFGFKKKHRLKIMNSKKIKIIKKLNNNLLPSQVYKYLKPLSYETILFFYAVTKDRKVRSNLVDFLKKYSMVSLSIKGKDLKEIGVSPSKKYSSIFKKIFHKKINGKLKNKEDEIKEAKKYRKQS